MKLDNNWKVPDGFVAIKNYRNDPSGEIVVGEVRLELSTNKHIDFYVGDDYRDIPALPLRGYGEIWHVGWETPTDWAIDASGQCWMDNAHGGCLAKVNAKELISVAEQHQHITKVHIKHLLNMKLEEASCPRCGGTGKIVE